MPRNKENDPKTRQVTLQFQVQEDARHKALFDALKAKAEAVNLGLSDFALLCVRWGFETAGAKAQAHYDRLKAMRNATWDDDDPPAVPLETQAPAPEGEGDGDRYKEQLARFDGKCTTMGCKNAIEKDRPMMRDAVEKKNYCLPCGEKLKEAA